MRRALFLSLAASAAVFLFGACGGPCVAGTCTFGGGTWNETCDTGGSCVVTATDGADVTFSCPDGSCSMTCESAAGCVLDCPGGSCSLQCSGTDTCEITSCTDSCALSCGGAATCSSSCDLTQSCSTAG